MKYIFKCMLISTSLTALAQEQVNPRTAQKVLVSGASAILLRTHGTPDMVRLTFKMPIKQRVCKATELRSLMKASAADCGTETRTVRVQRARNVTEEVSREYAKSCMVRESVCVFEAIELSEESDTIRITFRDLPQLRDSESESFLVTAEATSVENTDFRFTVKTLETVETYKVLQVRLLGLLAMDRFEVVRE